ncbi:class II fructose-bisphosphate aldolase [Desertihabitans brevis]|uniref:Class II fructose-bisphosphate aldolase n=1 Tax=Desertihabitans brevis TaxID=2268447 RepID=A0A367YYV5_9ACTN|nr:class II fructose-bisphosphate aldolase [Desertihabitans brevis]RCK70689.1 class II fructose-bisphosphate aldolase [Desertihabitans brevis]
MTDLRTLAREAAADHVGLGAFNVIQLEHATALVQGAERAGRPVVLQISQNAVKYHGALEPVLAATLAVARGASVPVVVHLDHAEDTDLIRRAVELGVHSVMYDGSHLDYEANVATTAEMVRFCHDAGVVVEAELGEVGGKDGVHAPGARTDPEEAAAFVGATGVDLLAVAVGSSHAMTTRDAVLDVELIGALADRLDVPLVLHGSSGVSDAGMQAAIAAGMTKINVSTHLNQVMTGAVRRVLEGENPPVDPRKWMAPARQAVADEVARLLSLYGAAATAGQRPA